VNSIRSVVVDGPEKVVKKNDEEVIVVEEKDWSLMDLELLKKQMVKFPVGMPGRWEISGCKSLHVSFGSEGLWGIGEG